MDPGFPEEGANSGGGGGTNLLFGIIFAENCIKMKKFDWGDARDARPLDPSI